MDHRNTKDGFFSRTSEELDGGCKMVKMNMKMGVYNMGKVFFVLYIFSSSTLFLPFKKPPFDEFLCPIMEKKKTINVERELWWWVCKKLRTLIEGFPLCVSERVFPVLTVSVSQ